MFLTLSSPHTQTHMILSDPHGQGKQTHAQCGVSTQTQIRSLWW